MIGGYPTRRANAEFKVAGLAHNCGGDDSTADRTVTGLHYQIVLKSTRTQR